MKKENLDQQTRQILESDFSTFEIVRVPDDDDRRLIDENSSFGGHFVFLDVYMRESSRINGNHPLITVAKIYRAFHHCMVSCLLGNHGRVRGFHGDRIMGVFSGDDKVNEAVDCANYMVGCFIEVLQPRIRALLNDSNYEMGVGVSMGKALVIKAPLLRQKSTCQLLWIGDAPYWGAQLSENANAWKGRINICTGCYEKLLKENRYHVDQDGNRTDKWTHGALEWGGSLIDMYRSTWYYSLP